MSTKSNWKYITLLKIILISLNLRIGIQLIFPNSFIGYDPWWHKTLIDEIVQSGSIPNMLPYSSIPGFHIFFSNEIITTGITNDFIVIR